MDTFFGIEWLQGHSSHPDEHARDELLMTIHTGTHEVTVRSSWTQVGDIIIMGAGGRHHHHTMFGRDMGRRML